MNNIASHPFITTIIFKSVSDLLKYLFIFLEVESDLPENLRDEAVLCFEAAVANKMQVGDAITKVQNDVLKKCDDVYKGQRYKGFIKFDYETNVVTINVSRYVINYMLYSDKLSLKAILNDIDKIT